MALQNLFIRTRKMIGGIQLDAVLSESHNNTVTLTKNPIEFGADITDHAIIEPKKITIEAEVTDTPLGGAAFGQIVDTVTGLFGSATSNNSTRSNVAYNAMVALMDEREPLQVQTKLKLYENMVITSVDTRQDKQTGRVARLIIALEEVRIVESQLVDLPAEKLRSGTTQQQATSSDNRGRQEPVEPQETVNRSVLKTVKDWILE